VPFTVKVKSAEPTFREVGLMEVVVGTGLFTVRVWAPEVPPPGAGFVTVMERVPEERRSEARTVAVS
jgi:hypothetical protein